MGDVLLFLGDYARASEHFTLALRQAGTLPLGQQVQEKSSLQRKIGATFERQGDYDGALAQFHQALASLTAVSSRYPVERARVLNDIGYVHMRRGQIDEAETYFQRALWSVEPSSQPGVVASIYNRLGGVYYLKEDLKTASEWARKSLALRIETGDLAGVARLYNNLGILEWRLGQWDEAIADFSRGVELNIQLNDVEATAELHLNIGLVLSDKGELDEARRYLEECLQTGKQIGHTFLQAQSRQNLSYLCLVAGRWDESVRHARESMRLFDELGIQDGLVDLNLVIAEASIGGGWLVEAEQAHGAVLTALQGRSGDRARLTSLARAERLAGKLAWKRGEREQARALLEACAEQFTHKENTLDLGRTLSDLAALALECGDQSAAQTHASQARAIFTQLGAKLDLERVPKI
jgi:tetratricopeptide (TPR) repeat protein